jgi:hypothetical protein
MDEESEESVMIDEETLGLMQKRVFMVEVDREYRKRKRQGR